MSKTGGTIAALRDLCQPFLAMTTLQGAVIVSIQSPVGERRIKHQLDPDQEPAKAPSKRLDQ